MNGQPDGTLQTAKRPGLLRREAGRLIGAVVVIALLAIFIIENSRTVRVTFLFWRVNTSLAWALLTAGALGLLAGLAIAWLRRFRHR